MTNLKLYYKALPKSRLEFLAAQLFLNRLSAPSSLNKNIGIVCTAHNRLSENRFEV